MMGGGSGPGLSLARFEQLKALGQGSFGTAYLVRDTLATLATPATDAAAASGAEGGGAPSSSSSSSSSSPSASALYVVKRIDISSMDAKGKRAALGEVEVLSRLDHPNICAYYGSWIEGDPPHLHILLEYCDGGDLSHSIKKAKGKRRFFTEAAILSWFVQLSSAILYCHARRILHRDLKASNIFLHGPGRVIKLADFGIARVLHSEGSMASTVIGTPYYMSPELCNNESYSYKSDIWSLGCVLYEMCTLRHAFDAGNMCALVLSILRGKYPPLPPHYPPALAALVDSMLQLDPGRRPGMAEILSTPIVQASLAQAARREDNAGRKHFARAHNTLAGAAQQQGQDGEEEGEEGEGEEDAASAAGGPRAAAPAAAAASLAAGSVEKAATGGSGGSESDPGIVYAPGIAGSAAAAALAAAVAPPRRQRIPNISESEAEEDDEGEDDGEDDEEIDDDDEEDDEDGLYLQEGEEKVPAGPGAGRADGGLDVAVGIVDEEDEGDDGDGDGDAAGGGRPGLAAGSSDNMEDDYGWGTVGDGAAAGLGGHMAAVPPLAPPYTGAAAGAASGRSSSSDRSAGGGAGSNRSAGSGVGGSRAAVAPVLPVSVPRALAHLTPGRKGGAGAGAPAAIPAPAAPAGADFSLGSAAATVGIFGDYTKQGFVETPGTAAQQGQSGRSPSAGGPYALPLASSRSSAGSAAPQPSAVLLRSPVRPPPVAGFGRHVVSEGNAYASSSSSSSSSSSGARAKALPARASAPAGGPPPPVSLGFTIHGAAAPFDTRPQPQARLAAAAAASEQKRKLLLLPTSSSSSGKATAVQASPARPPLPSPASSASSGGSSFSQGLGVAMSPTRGSAAGAGAGAGAGEDGLTITVASRAAGRVLGHLAEASPSTAGGTVAAREVAMARAAVAGGLVRGAPRAGDDDDGDDDGDDDEGRNGGGGSSSSGAGAGGGGGHAHLAQQAKLERARVGIGALASDDSVASGSTSGPGTADTPRNDEEGEEEEGDGTGSAGDAGAGVPPLLNPPPSVAQRQTRGVGLQRGGALPGGGAEAASGPKPLDARRSRSPSAAGPSSSHSRSPARHHHKPAALAQASPMRSATGATAQRPTLSSAVPTGSSHSGASPRYSAQPVPARRPGQALPNLKAPGLVRAAAAGGASAHPHAHAHAPRGGAAAAASAGRGGAKGSARQGVPAGKRVIAVESDSEDEGIARGKGAAVKGAGKASAAASSSSSSSTSAAHPSALEKRRSVRGAGSSGGTSDALLADVRGLQAVMAAAERAAGQQQQHQQHQQHAHHAQQNAEPVLIVVAPSGPESTAPSSSGDEEGQRPSEATPTAAGAEAAASAPALDPAPAPPEPAASVPAPVSIPAPPPVPMLALGATSATDASADPDSDGDGSGADDGVSGGGSLRAPGFRPLLFDARSVGRGSRTSDADLMPNLPISGAGSPRSLPTSGGSGGSTTLVAAGEAGAPSAANADPAAASSSFFSAGRGGLPALSAVDGGEADGDDDGFGAPGAVSGFLTAALLPLGTSFPSPERPSIVYYDPDRGLQRSPLHPGSHPSLRRALSGYVPPLPPLPLGEAASAGAAATAASAALPRAPLLGEASLGASSTGSSSGGQSAVFAEALAMMGSVMERHGGGAGDIAGAGGGLGSKRRSFRREASAGARLLGVAPSSDAAPAPAASSSPGLIAVPTAVLLAAAAAGARPQTAGAVLAPAASASPLTVDTSGGLSAAAAAAVSAALGPRPATVDGTSAGLEDFLPSAAAAAAASASATPTAAAPRPTASRRSSWENKRLSWGRAQRELAVAATHLEIAKNLREMLRMGAAAAGGAAAVEGEGDGGDLPVASAATPTASRDDTDAALPFSSDASQPVVIRVFRDSADETDGAGAGGAVDSTSSSSSSALPTGVIPTHAARAFQPAEARTAAAEPTSALTVSAPRGGSGGGAGASPSPNPSPSPSASPSVPTRPSPQQARALRRHSTGSSPLLRSAAELAQQEVGAGAGVSPYWRGPAGTANEPIAEENEDEEDAEEEEGEDEHEVVEEGEAEGMKGDSTSSPAAAASAEAARAPAARAPPAAPLGPRAPAAAAAASAAAAEDPEAQVAARMETIRAHCVKILGRGKYESALEVLRAVPATADEDEDDEDGGGVGLGGGSAVPRGADPLTKLVQDIGPHLVARLQLLMAFEDGVGKE
jgi:NIMA (never in mitosis gene a)-related kinase